jgi:nucleoside-diphosphate-sugar epimerase
MKASEANSQKTAIVVGATGIIGRAITAALAKDGRTKYKSSRFYIQRGIANTL